MSKQNGVITTLSMYYPGGNVSGFEGSVEFSAPDLPGRWSIKEVNIATDGTIYIVWAPTYSKPFGQKMYDYGLELIEEEAAGRNG